MAISKREFVSACILEAEVGTNCPQGGDTGHGGRTVIRFIDKGSTDITDRSGFEGEAVIQAGGDAEASLLADALEWAGQELRVLIERNRAESGA